MSIVHIDDFVYYNCSSNNNDIKNQNLVTVIEMTAIDTLCEIVLNLITMISNSYYR